MRDGAQKSCTPLGLQTAAPNTIGPKSLNSVVDSRLTWLRLWILGYTKLDVPFGTDQWSPEDKAFFFLLKIRGARPPKKMGMILLMKGF